MDLQPVELQDLIDDQVGDSYNNIPSVEFVKNDFFKESVYEDTRIEEIVKIQRDKTMKEIIENVLICCEANDVYQMHHLVSQLKEIRFYKNITTDEATKLIIILDKYVRNNYRDLNFANDIFSIMNDLMNMREIKFAYKEEGGFRLDWKVYYKMFVLYYGFSKYEFAVNYTEKFLKDFALCDFIKRANKLFKFTQEDYSFLKEEILRRMVTIEGQIAFALLTAHLFLPAEYFAEDAELQEKFMTVLESKSELSNYVLLNFCKIITKLKISKEKLIDMVFSLSFCFMSEGLTQTYFSWPSTIYKERSSTVPICYILANFLLRQEFSEFKDKILRNLEILRNLISEDLTENNSSESSFSMIKLLLRNVKQLSSEVTEYEVSEYDYFREYKVIDQYKASVEEIIKLFYPIVSKCLLYNEASTFSVFIEYMNLSYCHTDDFREIINFLFENNSDDFNFLIKKIKIFMRCYIDHIEEKNVYQFLNDFIDTAIEKISCVSGSLNNNILDFFNNLLTICLRKRKVVPPTPRKSSNFAKLCVKIINSCEQIVKKMLLLFSFFSSILEEMSYNLFFYHMTEYIDANTADNICKMITNFFNENILKDAKELSFLSYLISHFYRRGDWTFSLEENIWNYCYKNLVDDSESTSVMKDIPKDQFTYIKKLLPYLERIEEINKEQFIKLVNLLLQGKEDKRKVGFLMMKFFFYNLTLPGLKGKKIYYPSEESLKFGLDVYERVIKPY